MNPEEYNKLHYTPIETHPTGVSYTLAYCYADWSISNIAKVM